MATNQSKESTQGSSVLSQTLQSITFTKIRELEKLSESYESRKNAVLEAAAQPEMRQRERIKCLIKGVKQLDVERNYRAEYSSIARFLIQSEYDASFPDSMLDNYEMQLRRMLEIKTREQGLAHLYSRLLCEWMDDIGSSEDYTGDTNDEESFEVIERQKQRLQELCDRFDEVCFNPLDTDEHRITAYLESLYEDAGKDGAADLKTLRRDIQSSGTVLRCESAPFNQSSLEWCISSILKQSLLSEGKQRTLRDFVENKVVLDEIADVLNMRWADLEQWEWFAGENGIPVMPRRDLSGKYRIWMDEDVLQAILTQYIGVSWCVFLKRTLRTQVQTGKTWKLGQHTASQNLQELRFKLYLSGMRHANENESVKVVSRNSWIENFFCSALPSTVERDSFADAYEDNKTDDSQDNSKDNNQRGTNVKQRLLRKLATEIFLQNELKGSVAVVQTDLKWFATGLSHTTIFAVMKFIGFSDEWIQWFKKYLEAPLNMDNAREGRTATGPRTRRRGVPMAHGPEKLLGEIVLYFLDLAVYRKTGVYLHRLHDDIWLWGEASKVAEAWKVLQEIAEVFGLEFNRHKTGSAYLSKGDRDPKIIEALPNGRNVSMGFLELNQESGEWEINQDNVRAHVTQLRKQLQECKSVLTWIQTWNSCIGRFFGNTFGEPAFIFGRKHVDSVLNTYRQMQEELFGSENLASHIKAQLKNRFDAAELSDAFLFFPEELGGLGVRNPFIRLLLVRGEIQDSREERLKRFLEDECDAYETGKRNWEDKTRQAKERLVTLFCQVGESDVPKINDFLSLEEYGSHREEKSLEYARLYEELTSMPRIVPISSSHLTVHSKHEAALRDTTSLPREEMGWLAVLYHEQLLRDFGGLRLIPKNFMPLAVLEMMRSKTPAWRMVI